MRLTQAPVTRHNDIVMEFQAVYLIVPFLIWGSHYLGLKLDLRSKQNIEMVQSLAAGLAVGYVFLYLIPEVTRHGYENEIETMSIALLGFVFFHIALKVVFKTTNTKRQHFLSDEIHLLAVSLYNFIITFTLIELIKVNQAQGLLLLFLIVTHTTLSELSHKELNKDENQRLKTPMIFLATILGALVPVFGLVDPLLRSVMFSFTSGAIIYISIREEIPEGRDGNPLLFIIGVFFLLTVFTVFTLG